MAAQQLAVLDRTVQSITTVQGLYDFMNTAIVSNSGPSLYLAIERIPQLEEMKILTRDEDRHRLAKLVFAGTLPQDMPSC